MGLIDTVFDVAVFDTDNFDGNQARAGQIVIESPITSPLFLDSSIPAAAAGIVLDSTIAAAVLDSTIPATATCLVLDSSIISPLVLESPIED